MASLTTVKVDDIVRCNVRGQRFFALVSKASHRNAATKKVGLDIRPLVPGKPLLTTFVTAYQVEGIWRRAKNSTIDV